MQPIVLSRKTNAILCTIFKTIYQELQVPICAKKLTNSDLWRERPKDPSVDSTIVPDVATECSDRSIYGTSAVPSMKSPRKLTNWTPTYKIYGYHRIGSSVSRSRASLFQNSGHINQPMASLYSLLRSFHDGKRNSNNYGLIGGVGKHKSFVQARNDHITPRKADSSSSAGLEMSVALQNDLMPINSAIKDRISVEPPRSFKLELIKAKSDSDPLNTWKHPHKLLQLMHRDERDVANVDQLKNNCQIQELTRKVHHSRQINGRTVFKEETPQRITKGAESTYYANMAKSATQRLSPNIGNDSLGHTRLTRHTSGSILTDSVTEKDSLKNKRQIESTSKIHHFPQMDGRAVCKEETPQRIAEGAKGTYYPNMAKSATPHLSPNISKDSLGHTKRTRRTSGSIPTDSVTEKDSLKNKRQIESTSKIHHFPQMDGRTVCKEETPQRIAEGAKGTYYPNMAKSATPHLSPNISKDSLGHTKRTRHTSGSIPIDSVTEKDSLKNKRQIESSSKIHQFRQMDGRTVSKKETVQRIAESVECTNTANMAKFVTSRVSPNSGKDSVGHTKRMITDSVINKDSLKNKRQIESISKRHKFCQMEGRTVNRRETPQYIAEIAEGAKTANTVKSPDILKNSLGHSTKCMRLTSGSTFKGSVRKQPEEQGKPAVAVKKKKVVHKKRESKVDSSVPTRNTGVAKKEQNVSDNKCFDRNSYFQNKYWGTKLCK